MPITLLIPELIWSNPDDASAFAGTSDIVAARYLARQAPVREPLTASEVALVAAAGWSHGEAAPLAAMRLAGETGDDVPRAAEGDFWLCADPVSLRFHQDRLILGDATQLALDAGEVASLVRDLNQALAPVEVFAPHPERWYLRLPDATADDLGSPPPSLVTGRALHPEQLGASRRCRQLANEIQILLHAHPVNVARQQRGAAQINALWLWGGGALPAAPAMLRAPLGNDALARGLARLASGDAPAPPADFQALTGRPTGPAAMMTSLVHLDGLATPSHYQDGAAFTEALRDLDRHWLAPAFTALRQGRLDRLEVVAPTAYGTLRWTFRPRDAWLALLLPDWLRRGRSADLAQLAHQLASAPTP